jgi:hypothetical protein
MRRVRMGCSRSRGDGGIGGVGDVTVLALDVISRPTAHDQLVMKTTLMPFSSRRVDVRACDAALW